MATTSFSFFDLNRRAQYTSKSMGRDVKKLLEKYGNLIKMKDEFQYILHAGCGNGYLTNKILFPRIKNNLTLMIATDSNSQLIECAKKENENSKIEYLDYDYMHQSFTLSHPQKFDHIYSFYQVQWTRDINKWLMAMSDVLKNGGQIFITLMVTSALHKTIDLQSEKGPWSKWIRKGGTVFAEPNKTPEISLRTVLEVHCFTVEILERTKTVVTSNLEEVCDMCMALNPFLDNIPASPDYMRREYKRDFYEKVEEVSKCEGGYEIYQPMLIVARKTQ